MKKLLLLFVVVLFSVASTKEAEEPSLSEIVSIVNNGGHTWTAAENMFTHMSVEERRSYVMNPPELDIPQPESTPSQPFHTPIPDGALPDNYDPRQESWMTPARDQQSCGSCWTFGSSEAFADRRGKMIGTTPMLSTQNILSCLTPELCCCNGGWIYAAWNFMSTSGIVSDSCFNYQSGSGTCSPATCPINPESPSCPNGGDATIYKAFNVEWLLSEFQTMYHLYHFGPLTMTYTVYTDFFSYATGVYHHVRGGEAMGSHAVELVGWGEENGTPFWLVKNSWGTGWAIDGYFKILRGTNECDCEEPYNSLLSGFPYVPKQNCLNNVNPAVGKTGTNIALTGMFEKGDEQQSVNVTICGADRPVQYWGRAKYAIVVYVYSAPPGTSGTVSDGSQIHNLDEEKGWHKCFLTMESELTFNVSSPSSLSSTIFYLCASLSTDGNWPADYGSYAVLYDIGLEDTTSLDATWSLMRAPYVALVTAPYQSEDTVCDVVLMVDDASRDPLTLPQAFYHIPSFGACRKAVNVTQYVTSTNENINLDIDHDKLYCGLSVGTYGRWFKWTAPENGLTFFSTDVPDTDFDTKVHVFSGNCGNLVGTCVGANNDATSGGKKSIVEVVSQYVTTGREYLIAVSGYDTASGLFGLYITQHSGGFCNHLQTFNDSIDGDNTDTRIDIAGNYFCNLVVGTYGLWYSWTADYDGSVRFSTDDPSTIFDTELFVFSGTCSSRNCLGANDDVSDSNKKSVVTLNVEKGETYLIAVTGYGENCGKLDLHAERPGQIYNSNQTDCEALLDLWTGTNGKNWKDSAQNRQWADAIHNISYPFLYHCCEVLPSQDVRCSLCGEGHPGPLRMRVVSISLPGRNLTGKLLESIGNLQKLQSVDLSENYLGGFIPMTFSGLHLETIDLHANKLEGLFKNFIPIGTESIDIHGNLVSGSFDQVTFSRIKTNTITLDARQNKLNGTIQSEKANRCEKLQNLLLGGNSLSADNLDELFGEKSVFGSNLISLDLSNNNFSGKVPPQLARLSNLETLDLHGNSLEGRITSFLLSPNLQKIDLSNNNFTGDIPEIRDSGDVLQVLNLWKNSFVGKIPTSYADLRSLFLMDLSFNNLEGNIPDFSSMDSLQFLFLQGNKFHWLELPSGLAEENKSHTKQVGDIILVCKDISAKRGFFKSLKGLWIDDFYMNYENCECGPGLYGKAPLNCHPCSGDKMRCKNGVAVASLGYWATPPTTRKEQLYDASRTPLSFLPCPGVGTKLTSCQPSDSDPSEACSSGYRGRLCSSCERGRFQWGDDCVHCPGNTTSKIAFAVFFTGAVVGIFVCGFFVGNRSAGFFRILLFFLQVVSQIKVPLPVSIAPYSRGVSAVSLLRIAGPECYFSWNFDLDYVTTVLEPIGMVVVVGITWIMGSLCRVGLKGKHTWKELCSRDYIFVFHLGYLGLVNMVLTPLGCAKDPGDGKSYMVNVPDHACSALLIGVSCGLVVVLILVIPAVISWLVWNDKFPNVLHYLYSSYQKRYRFWELLYTIQRVLIAITFLSVNRQSSFQAVFLSTTLLCSLVLHLSVGPFCTKLENLLQTISYILLLMNLTVSLKLSSPEVLDQYAAIITIFVANCAFSLTCIYFILRKTVGKVWKTIVGEHEMKQAQEQSNFEQIVEPLLPDVEE